jgi:large subunit ribosomal protein L6
MSRIAKVGVKLNSAKDLVDNGDSFVISGPLGTLNIPKVKGVEYIINQNVVTANCLESANAGTAIRLLKSALKGVYEGFTKVIEISGSGTKVQLKEKKLSFDIGFSHSVFVDVIEGVTANVAVVNKLTGFGSKPVDVSVITLKSINARLLGDFAASILKLRKTRVYGDFLNNLQGSYYESKKKGGANG